MKFTRCINDDWFDYYKTTAICQLSNYGIIFLDDYGNPIDNEFELDELFNDFISGDYKENYDSRKYLSSKEYEFVKDWNEYLDIADNLTFYNNAKNLSDVGYNWMLELLEPNELQQIEEHVNFEGIGNDVYTDMSISSEFTSFGFIIKF